VTADDGIQDESWFRGLHEDSKSRLLEQAFKYANHPRENVSWYQAVAFTRWLTLKYQQAGIISQHDYFSGSYCGFRCIRS
jgi:hypothetical protein